MIEIKSNEGFFDPEKEVVGRGQTREGAIKGSLHWKPEENKEMIKIGRAHV